jgi:hypothetical protein
LVAGSAYVALAQGGTPPTPFGGRGMMGGWNYGQTFTGTVPFGRGGMTLAPALRSGASAGVRGWEYGSPFTGTVPYGPGMMGAWGGPMSNMHVDIWTAVAKELGLTYDQLQAELSPRTLEQLAQDKGVKLEKLQEVAKSAWKAEINELVEAGTLTREQADWMIQRMDAAGFPMLGLGRGLGLCVGV